MSSSNSRAIEAVIDGRTSAIAARKSSVVAGACSAPSDRSNAAPAAFRAANSMSAAEKYCDASASRPRSTSSSVIVAV